MLIQAVAAALEFIFWASAISDVILWRKSSKNRKQRKTAKREGKAIPKRDAWNRAFVACTIILATVFVLLIVRVAVTAPH